MFVKKSVQLFIVTNPPFTPFLGYFFNRLRGTKYHLLIYDMYPDALVQLGKTKKEGYIHRIWSRWNKHLLKNASTIYTLSKGMAHLIKSYANVNLQIIPNWTDSAFIKPINKAENPFARKHHQIEKITIMYSGNMGASHAIEKIPKLALALKNDDAFNFIIIGEGTKKPVIQQMKEQYKIDNLTILPYQPMDILPYSLACADVGIVTLSANAEDVSVPSKAYNLLAAGVALFVIGTSTSELADLVNEYKCGVHFEEDKLDEMVRFLREIKSNPDRLQQLKENARKASYGFTPANANHYKATLNSNMYVPKTV